MLAWGKQAVALILNQPACSALCSAKVFEKYQQMTHVK